MDRVITPKDAVPRSGKGKVATPVFTESIQLILRISEVLGSSEKKEKGRF